MLTLIKGRNGSGKTSWCLERVIARAKQGKPSMLIVPENIDYTFELELVERLKPSQRRFCEVTDFRKLCRDIIRKQGGSARVFLDVPERVTLLRRAVQSCSGELTFYGKRRKDISFYENLGALFEELRSAGAGPEDLRTVSEACRSDLSRKKFQEIALLLERYEEAIRSGYFDSVSEMEYAAGACAASGLVSGKEIYIDGFVALSTVMRRFILTLMECGDDVYLTVGCDGSRKDSESAFAATARSADRLAAQVKERFGVWPRTVTLPRDDSKKPSGIISAEGYFGTGDAPSGSDGVTVFSGESVYDEVERCADEILRLIREEDARFRDIAVLMRDVDPYREAVSRIFERYDIRFVLDTEETLEYSPCTAFLLAAMEMNRGIRTDSLLRMLKTGICSITEEEISILENYVFVHDIEGERWKDAFTENPEGMGEIREYDEELLAQTEAVRCKVMEWMTPYLEKAGTALGRNLLREAYRLLERAGGLDGMAEIDAPGRCDAQLALNMIDRFDLLLGDEPASRDEVCDLLRILSKSTRALQIPSSVDAVIVGEADRTALLAPETVFVLGLNEGIFPRENFDGGLFTLEERDLLYERKYYLSGAFEERVDMELNYLYRAVSAPTKRLYLSWTSKDISGAALECSAEIKTFAELLGLKEKEKREADGIVNLRTAVNRYMNALSSENHKIRQALEHSSAAEECVSYNGRSQRRSREIADLKLANRLAGNRQRISSSKIDIYERCRLRFFAQYLLNLKPLRRAEMSPNEAGNFVHEIMEKMMKETKGDLLSISEPELRLLCARLSDEYTDNLVPPENRSNRMQGLCDSLKNASIRLGLRLRSEQEQCAFRPTDFELEIGRDADIPGPEFALEDGSTAVVEGKIDRVDIYEKDGEKYVRVVDYKTGDKDFKLSDIWQGLNVQMLVYLFALKNNGKAYYGTDLHTAGVLYLPSDPKPAGNANDAKKLFRMQGLLIEDPEVLKAMEAEGKGDFIPAKLYKGSWTTDNLATLEEFGKIEHRVEELITEMAQAVRAGKLEANPAVKDDNSLDVCKSCDYKSLCDKERVDLKTEWHRMVRKLNNKEILGEEEQDG